RQGWPEYDQWLKACYERASAYNLQFAAPLDENEVIGIAKSIAKWTSSHFNETSFKEYVKRTHTKIMQSSRGKKSHGGGRKKICSDKVLEIKKMISDGNSYRYVSGKCSVSIGFISKVIKEN
ncbi:primase C-terminal domain-containing protein, partial [Enterobacter asburiae]